MHSMRQRACDIAATAISAFLAMALLTAVSTIMRDIVLRPRPIVSDVRISSASPLYQMRAPTLLSLAVPDAALYYVPSSEGGGAPERRLPSNIVVMDMADGPADTDEDRRRKAWQRQRVPPGHEVGIRSSHRVALYLSGIVDFAPCWDWNTKAIYVSFVARFESRTTTQNDVVMLDAVLRPASLPANIAHLAERRRRERAALAAAVALPAGSVALAEELTDLERQELAVFERSLHSREHDHPSVYLDHIDMRVVMNESYKYFVDAFDDASLVSNTVEVVLRYQVMSYSGWAPVREDVLGHQVKVRTAAQAVPWDAQRS